jgi:predicted MFS family arabinose efflux permease
MFQALFNISVSPFYLRNSTKEIRTHLFAMNSSINMFAHFVGYLIGGYMPEIIRWFNPGMVKASQFRISMVVAISIVILSNLVFMRIKRKPIPRIKRRLFEGLREKEWNIMGKLLVPKLCFAFGGGLIVPFLNLYLSSKFNFSSKTIGVSYAILQVFIFAAIFMSPLLVKRTTHLKFILTTSLLSIPFMIAMGLTGNIVVVLACFFMRGTLMNMSSPITSMFEMERVSERECVFASAMILFGYNLVYTFSTRLGGFLIEKFSFGPTFYVAAAFYSAAVFFYYRFFRGDEKHDQEIKDLPAPQEIVEAA